MEEDRWRCRDVKTELGAEARTFFNNPFDGPTTLLKQIARIMRDACLAVTLKAATLAAECVSVA